MKIEGGPIGAPANTGFDLALFVLWAKARHCEERILSDLDARFDVLDVREVAWSRGRIMENYQRFYADIPTRGVYHALNKGVDPLLAVIVRDPVARVEARSTSRGVRTVNANFLDAKTSYRNWTGQFAVHSSETVWEMNRDLIMLLGSEALPDGTDAPLRRGGTVTRIDRDLTGAEGWASACDLFGTLNRSAVYSVLGAVDDISADEILRTRPIDLLTDDCRHLHTVLNAVPRATPAHGGRFRVSVAGKAVPIGVRVVGDGYFPPKWASAILGDRQLGSSGFYRSPPRAAFDELAYRTLVHRPPPIAEELQRLAELASLLRIEGWAPTVDRTKSFIDRILEERGCGYTRPLDGTVEINPDFSRAHSTALGRLNSLGRRGLATMDHHLIGNLRHAYGTIRDRTILAVPWVRGIWQSVMG